MKWLSIFLLLQAVVGEIIKGSSLFGLETELRNTDCSWVQPASYYIDELGRRGFNYLRVPFSGQYVREGDFHIMDDIFKSAVKNNMSVCLDWHRNQNAYQDDWLENISLQEYFQLYETLLNRYKDHPSLQMVSLFNEYKGDDAAYWQQQMGMVVNHFENQYPYRFKWLIGCPRWSGDCHAMDWSQYPFQSRIFVDHHKYIFSGASNPDDWSKSFYHDHDQVVVGEWGFFSDKPEQVQWAQGFVQWLKQQGIHDTFFWVSVSSSGDTGGMWKDCRVFEEEKYQLLQKLWQERRLQEEEEEEDWTEEDEEDEVVMNATIPLPPNKQSLRVGWGEDRPRKPRRCSNFHHDHNRCERHRACCYRKADDICFKCV